MSGDEPGVIAITQRELLLEMREDIRGLKATVDEIARDQALGAERRANMQRSADAPCAARSCTGSSGACTSGRGRPSGSAGPGTR
jgi:hypothetical protein